jgi:hypothetical protein
MSFVTTIWPTDITCGNREFKVEIPFETAGISISKSCREIFSLMALGIPF